jgi:hypothetical protein
LLHFQAHVVDKTGWICFTGEKEIKAVSCSRASCLVLLQALVSIPFRFPHFHCLVEEKKIQCFLKAEESEGEIKASDLLPSGCQNSLVWVFGID